LSAGKDKRENFERLLRDGKLGGLAVLRNLRLMLASGVDPQLIASGSTREWREHCRFDL
jgi:60 kDa SS-A/Ro ribonucleoprotein